MVTRVTHWRCAFSAVLGGRSNAGSRSWHSVSTSLTYRPLRATAAVRILLAVCAVRPLFIAEPRHIDALRVVTRAAPRALARPVRGSQSTDLISVYA